MSDLPNDWFMEHDGQRLVLDPAKVAAEIGKLTARPAAIDIVNEAACLIWSELCPGMVMGDEDRYHYEMAARAVLALAARWASDKEQEALAELANKVVGIQEDLPNDDDRAVLGEVAHHLRKIAARPASNEVRETVGYVVYYGDRKLFLEEKAAADFYAEHCKVVPVYALATRPASNEVRAKVILECATFVEWFEPSANWNIEALRQAARGLRALVAGPGESEPDWPPRASASFFPEGQQSYGSTGQLFEVKNGQWIRVRDPGESKGGRIALARVGDY